MSRTDLRPVPNPVGDFADRSALDAELAGFFTDWVESGRQDDDAPDYEELEAAVDGRLDPVEAECFASRLVGDPTLQREYEALVALRDTLAPAAAARFDRPARAVSARRWVGYAAAALIVAAAGIGLEFERRQGGPVTRGSGSLSAAAARSEAASVGGRQILFADSFESGDAAHWSN